MPGPKKKPTLGKRPAQPSVSSTKTNRAARQQTLVLIDSRPLQRAAWAEFHSTRKRHEKAARDLHRHEEIDRPAYDSWLHRTFPVWTTTLRELYSEVAIKSRQVRTVIALAEMTGRSLKKLWREQKEYEANPEAFEDDEDPAAESDRSTSHHDKNSSSGDTGDDDSFDDDSDSRRSRKSSGSSQHRSSTAPPAQAAKDIYRRLVQHIHPDRGGGWTPARQRLWHEVQQAWAAGDADWLARLEVEWESANEVLSPDSPVSRLQRAIAELIAARRDIERKLRDYRRSPQWRFTLSEKKRHILHARTYANFRHDVEILQQQLDHLNRTIAAWEKDEAPKSKSRSRYNDSIRRHL